MPNPKKIKDAKRIRDISIDVVEYVDTNPRCSKIIKNYVVR